MMKESELFSRELFRGDEEYTNYRIPGMLVTKKGTLLVYCEARREAADWAKMDLLLLRSRDHGKSFGDRILLAQGNDLHPTVNNPVMMEDLLGRIHFLYCEDYSVAGGRVLQRISEDDGISWSEPKDLTPFTHPEERNAFALGPGHGITLKDGTLLVPVWMVPRHYCRELHSHKPSVISTFYSKDHGATWALGEILSSTDQVISPNETSAAQTADGRVYLNIRHMMGWRARAFSDDGISRWEGYECDFQLPDPCCFGSTAVIEDGIHPPVLLFANCADHLQRKNVTVRAGFDHGKTFPVTMVLDAERGGYVEIAADSKSSLVYVLYENNKGESVHFARFPLELLLSEQSL